MHVRYKNMTVECVIVISRVYRSTNRPRRQLFRYRGLFKLQSRYFLKGLRKHTKTSDRIACTSGESRTRQLPNASLEPCCSHRLLDKALFCQRFADSAKKQITSFTVISCDTGGGWLFSSMRLADRRDPHHHEKEKVLL